MNDLLSHVDIEKLFAIVGGIATVAMTVINRYQKRQVKNAKNNVKLYKDQNELLKDRIYNTKIKIIKELFDFQQFSSLNSLLHRMYESSPIDRFTLMFVMNGKIDFHYLTVLMDEPKEPTKGLNEISPYTRLPIDNEYTNIVKEIELGRFVWRRHPDFKAGSVNDFLELEKIKSIGWAFVDRIKLDNENDIVVYCSFSSETQVLTRHQKKLIELTYSGRLKPYIETIMKVPNEQDSNLLKHLGNMQRDATGKNDGQEQNT